MVALLFLLYSYQFFTDDKKYGVSLAYHFTKDLDRFASSKIQESILLISNLLKQMGHRVHDEKQEYKVEGNLILNKKNLKRFVKFFTNNNLFKITFSDF